MAAVNSIEILHDLSPMARVYKDGRFERLGPDERCEPSLDEVTGVDSKDVEISTKNEVSARLYLPPNAAPGGKLPLLVYFHGGGFICGSAFSPIYQTHLNLIVAKANVVAVSVNYRLAPEFPLPTAYDDSWLALKWVASHSSYGGAGEKWIKDHADLGRVYLAGDSAGGNIAHQMAIRVGSEKLDGIHVKGLFLNCPFFWGEDPIGKESTLFRNTNAAKVWRYVCPNTSGCDDPRINPAADMKLSSLGCKRVLVYVGGKDFLRDRGCHYKEKLNGSGWGGKVDVVEAEEEDHVFSVTKPDCENAVQLLEKLAAFLNHE